MPMSVRLDARTERLLNRLARAKGQTKSEVVRDAIERLAREEASDKAASGPYEAIAHLIGCADSGGAGLSERTGEKFRTLLRERRRARRAG
jgi:hypothetical protein